MARKAVKSSATTTPRQPSKRAAPEPAPSRQSKRARAGRKSYAEPDSDEEGGENNKPSRQRKKRGGEEASDFEDADENADPSGSDVEETNKHLKDEELWRDGAKLEPGKQIIIKRPKAREAGDTPYTNETIHPNTMLFLKDLRRHNDRQWLKAHDADYRTSLQDFTTFLEKLSERVMEADSTVPELPVKDIIFRIYRDVRFSKDQTPYKTHFSAAWSRTGRKGPYAAYYVQIEPGGGSFVGGGLWQPEATALGALRSDIDRKPHKIKQVLNDAGMRQSFFGGVAANEKKTVKAFVNQTSNRNNALKKHPKGYDANHKDIELLRLRNFTVGTKLSDDEVVGAGGMERIGRLISCMVPFVTYLNGVVMPDNDEGESDGEDDDGDGDSDGGDDDDEEGGGDESAQ